MVLDDDLPFPPWSEVVEMYRYDTSEPLDYRVNDTQRGEGTTVFDVEYQSSGNTVPAWLVIPDGQGPFPVVLYAHGASGNRDWFLSDALALARDGFAGLLITGPDSREPYLPITTTWNAQLDIEGTVQWATDLRRGIDLLETLPEIDATRLGFVGYSAGAFEGAILAGLEGRVDAYVLAAGGQGFECTGVESSGGTCHVTVTETDLRVLMFYAGDISPSGLERYMRETTVLTPVPYVAHNESAAFLLQFGTTDETASRTSVQALFAAAPEPKILKWYESGHSIALAAYEFHRAWLERNV